MKSQVEGVGTKVFTIQNGVWLGHVKSILTELKMWSIMGADGMEYPCRTTSVILTPGSAVKT